MSKKDDEIKGPSRRQTVAVLGKVARTAKIFPKSESEKLVPQKLEVLRKKVEDLKKIGDISPVKLNTLLTVLSRQEPSSDIRKLMRIYFAQKLYRVVDILSDDSKLQSVSKIDFKNMRLLINMDTDIKRDFIDHLTSDKFIKDYGEKKRESVISHLISNDVLSLERDRKLLEGVNKGKPANERVKSIEMLSLLRDILRDTTKNPDYQDMNSDEKKPAMMKRLIELSKDPSARRVLLSELKTSKYKDCFNNIQEVINRCDLSDKELFELMVHYSDNKETWGQMPEDRIREKLDAKVQEYEVKDSKKAASVKNQLNLFDEDKAKREKPSLAQVVKEEWLNPINAFGLKSENGDRWSAVTGNIFSQDAVRDTSNREMMVRIGEKTKLWETKENKSTGQKEIVSVNWVRVLNPIVMIDYGLTSAEMFVNRGTQAAFGDDHPVARGIAQAPLAFLLRVPRFFTNIIGNAISKPIEAVVTAVTDAREQSKKPTETAYSYNEAQSIDSDIESIEGLITPRTEDESQAENVNSPAVQRVSPMSVDPTRQVGDPGVETGSEDDKEASVEVIEFNTLINELDVKEKVDQYLDVVNGMEMNEGERDPSFKEQIIAELTQLSDELLRRSEGGVYDQGLLEDTEEKLAVLEKRISALEKNERELDEIVNRHGKVSPGEEERKRAEVALAQKHVQGAIDNVREINLRFEEIRVKYGGASEQVEPTENAVVEAVVEEDSRRISELGMGEEKQPGESSAASVIEGQNVSPRRKFLGIMADVMKSLPGVALVGSLVNSIQERVKQRREAMSVTKPDDEKFPKKGLGEAADLGAEPDDLVLDAQSEEGLGGGDDLVAAEELNFDSDEDAGQSYVIEEDDELVDWTPQQSDQKGSEKSRLMGGQDEVSESEEEDVSAMKDQLQKVTQALAQGERVMAEIEGGGNEDEMETVPLTDEDQSSRVSRGGKAEPLVGSVGGDDLKASTKVGQSESSQRGEKGAATKEPTGLAGLWQSIKDAMPNITFRFGTAAARPTEAEGVDTTAPKAASGEDARAFERMQYNEVRLMGFAGELSKEKRRVKLEEWAAGLENQLGGMSGTLKEGKISFTGEQSIDVKDGDVVLRGFSKEMYKDFSENVLSGKKPPYSVSAANTDSYNSINEAIHIDKKAVKTSMSRLTSVGLFIQKLWSDVKTLVMGTPSNAAIEQAKAVGPREDVVDSTLQQVSTDKSVKSRAQTEVSKARPPIQRQETSEDVRQQTEQKLAEIFDSSDTEQQVSGPDRSAEQTEAKITPDPKPATIAHSPPTALGQSWMSVKVTIEQQPNFEVLHSTLDQCVQQKGLPPVEYHSDEATGNFSATVGDENGGKIAVSASSTASQVVMTEVRHSDTSIENMANIVLALPPEGQDKKYVISGSQKGRTDFEQQFKQRLDDAKGPEKSEPTSLSRGSTEE